MSHRYHHLQMINLQMLEGLRDPEHAVAYTITSSLKSIQTKIKDKGQQIDWQSLHISVALDDSLLPGASDMLKMQLSVMAK